MPVQQDLYMNQVCHGSISSPAGPYDSPPIWRVQNMNLTVAPDGLTATATPISPADVYTIFTVHVFKGGVQYGKDKKVFDVIEGEGSPVDLNFTFNLSPIGP